MLCLIILVLRITQFKWCSVLIRSYIYEINQIVVEKSKYQLEQLRLNESNEDDQIHINVDIDLFDFMALSQLFYSNSYRKFFKKSKDEDFSMKSIIKNYEKYKYLKDNVSERISSIRVGLQKKYPLLDISIQFPIISLVPERYNRFRE